MSEWQDISTARSLPPGTAVWLFCDGEIYIGYFDPPNPIISRKGMWILKSGLRRRNDGRPDEVFGTYASNVQPTLWLPLPTPPQESAE